MDVSVKVEDALAAPAHAVPRKSAWVLITLGALLLGLLIVLSLGESGGHAAEAAHGEAHGAEDIPPLWACGPFVGLLLCIAIFPLVPGLQHWWESNLNRLFVSAVFAAMALAWYVWDRGPASVEPVLRHAVLDEYIPFIVLLFSLYVISGGISLRGDLPAHPGTNCAFLGLGALLASFIGTTGASMLLIRPLLQVNSERRHVTHTVIFFIFLVSNIGGSLLPIGDPPLFLGYLRGVPFLWTFNLFVPWAVTVGILLGIYYLWDRWAYAREEVRDVIRDERLREPLSLRGTINFVWLVGVVLCVALIDPSKELPLLGVRPFPFLRELLQLGFVALSLITTPAGVRAANRFNYHAILEVAALFIGIFIAMQIPIEILHARGPRLGLTEPWQYFWATGALSAFLDNAPTYVVFFETAGSLTHHAGPGIIDLIGGGHIRHDLLAGVSLGAVFMGAMTYIGNGPNFMVKSIAEQAGVRVPSFFGYMIYSVGILVPVFILVTIVFL